MAKLKKIAIQINGDTFSIEIGHEVQADSVLILPLRGFVGAEYFGATKNVVIESHVTNEASLRARGYNV